MTTSQDVIEYLWLMHQDGLINAEYWQIIQKAFRLLEEQEDE